MLLQLGVIGYVFYQSYAGRESVVDASRLGCERSKLDREANAIGWRTAETAREHSVAQELHISLKKVKQLVKTKRGVNDVPDLVAAREYDRIAKGLEVRSRISCSLAFPKAGLFS